MTGQIDWTQFVHGQLLQENQRQVFRPLKYHSRLQQMAHTQAIAKIPEGVEELAANSMVFVQRLEYGNGGK